jgi:hypothetical protein
MTGSAWLDTLIMLLVVGIPVGFVLWYLRKPYDPGSVPRDALASRGKGTAFGTGLLIWPTRAYRKTLIDKADDASHDRENHEKDNAETFDANDFMETDERRAQVVEDLRRRE